MILFSLARKDLFYEKLLSVCVVASLCAVITPLLILFSLRFGVLDSLYHNLSSDPNNLEISMGANVRLTDMTLKEIAKREDVGFIIPKTRSLSLTVNIKGNDKVAQRVETLPSARGDPILVAMGMDRDLKNTECFISQTLQSQLNVNKGSQITVYVPRNVEGRAQTARATFEVMGVIKSGLLPRDTIMVNLDVTKYMEDFRDGYEPYVFSDGSRPNYARTFYPKARIYAKNIDAVPSLSEYLSRMTTVYDRSAQIMQVRQITSVLDFIFAGIALPSIIGGIIAFCGLIISLINKKQSSYALLRLSGLKLRSLYVIIMIEAFYMALSAFAVSMVLYTIVSYYFNLYFAPFVENFAAVSKLSGVHISIGFIATMVMTGFTALTCACIFLKVPLQKALRMV